MKAARKNVHFLPHVLRLMEKRSDSLSGTVNTTVDRYFEAVRRMPPKVGLARHFKPHELAVIAETCKGMTLEPAANIFTSIEWELREAGHGPIAAKVAKLDPWEQVLVAELIEEAA
ncbi:MAG: hypothetical protein IT536_04400 [Hyphomicrobiales bacterium]|nr:hypothetical protein [Hyphomicrobiales bacterium]